MATSLLAFRR